MKKHLLAICIIFLFLSYISVPISTTINAEKSDINIESSKQDIIDNNCLCQKEYDKDYTIDQLNSFNRNDEHGLITDFNDNWEQQKMVAPSGSSNVCGYVTDKYTGFPLENTKIDIRGTNYSDYTNSTGFYNIILPPTYAIQLQAYADGYLDKHYCCYPVYEDKTLWVNISLGPCPQESSIFYGYVIDKYTGDPVENAKVDLRWRNDDGYYDNTTFTNYLGFYSMRVGAPGEMRLCVYPDRYWATCWKPGSWYYISENKTVWANMSVRPYPPETSVIFGYIYDNVTGDPKGEVNVELKWSDGGSHHYSNFTVTDSLGFYSMNAGAGLVRIYTYADGYWDNRSSLYDIGENETVWINMSIDPLPPENSVVCGYITDFFTGEPVELVKVELNWEEYTYYRAWNKTITGTSGFYKMNLPAGEFYIDTYTWGYFYLETDLYNIAENETIWLNISIYPLPPMSSVVCGYITDEDSGEPIVDTDVNLDWRDQYGNTWWDFYYTNESGFYSFDIFAGEIHLEVWKYHYFVYNSGWITLGENETLWFNFTLKLDNTPPDDPYIEGPIYGKPGKELKYTFYTYDYQYDDVYYYVDWGDGNTTDWIGPYHHTVSLSLKHIWSEKGTYYIRAKAKDVYGYESDWGELQVMIPRTKAVTSNMLLLRLLERFPLFQQLWSVWRSFIV